MIIKEYFFNAVEQFSNDVGVADKLWHELEEKYSAKTRHYHTLAHLDDMLSQLIPLRDSFENWSIVVLAVAYHDAIYNPLRSDNEEKSVLLAIDRLR
ncbi:MAG TPA: hypothetical protein VFT90_03335, partial [Chryseosolibacter sp.]|nr:hypothetical protein [Chryseosolibacter sp.]